MMYLIIILCISNIITITYFLKEKKKEKERKRENEALIQTANNAKLECEKMQNQFQEIAQQAVADHLEKSKASIEYSLKAVYDNKERELNENYQKVSQSLQKAEEATRMSIRIQEERLNDSKQSSDKILEEYKEKLNVEADKYKNEKINEIESIIGARELEEIGKLQEMVEVYFDYFNECKEEKKIELEKFLEKIIESKEQANKEMAEIQKILDDFRAKRDVLNAEILRQRAIEEKEDFYKIIIDEASLHDLALLDEIKPKFSKFDLIQKLEYDNYVSKPAQEMVKRVLEGKKPCGIYKITRLKTGEVYIGKSTDISSRWIQHCKSCYHCGTISHSTFHSTLEKDGIQNFTWELLEEVEKEKLGEREKYWINFYDSKNYGMNEKVG